MAGRLLEIAGRLSLALLVLCILFHATFLAMAYAAEKLTDPPACKVAFAFPLPFAVCPGFGFGTTTEYLMALPGAILALPLLLPGLITDLSSSPQPYIILPVIVHVLGWGYLLASFFRRSRARRR